MLRLSQLRAEKGLTQKEVAIDLKIAQNTLSQYETGKREPDFDTLLRIARYFDVTIDYLLGNSKMENTFAKRLKELRKSKGYSQKELADFLYVNRSVIDQWENGESIPGADSIAKLCRMFGVTQEYLTGVQLSQQPPREDSVQSGPTVVVMSGGSGPVIHKTDEKKEPEHEEAISALVEAASKLSTKQIKSLLPVINNMNPEK